MIVPLPGSLNEGKLKKDMLFYRIDGLVVPNTVTESVDKVPVGRKWFYSILFCRVVKIIKFTVNFKGLCWVVRTDEVNLS